MIWHGQVFTLVLLNLVRIILLHNQLLRRYLHLKNKVFFLLFVCFFFFLFFFFFFLFFFFVFFCFLLLFFLFVCCFFFVFFFFVFFFFFFFFFFFISRPLLGVYNTTILHNKFYFCILFIYLFIYLFILFICLLMYFLLSSLTYLCGVGSLLEKSILPFKESGLFYFFIIPCHTILGRYYGFTLDVRSSIILSSTRPCFRFLTIT